MVDIEFVNGIKRLENTKNKYDLLIRALYQSAIDYVDIPKHLKRNKYKDLNDLPIETVIMRIKALDKCLNSRSLSINELHGVQHKDHVHRTEWLS